MDKKIKITLVKSLIGVQKNHVNTIKALGLNKVNSSAIHSPKPAVLGMIKQVNYLLEVNEIN